MRITRLDSHKEVNRRQAQIKTAQLLQALVTTQGNNLDLPLKGTRDFFYALTFLQLIIPSWNLFVLVRRINSNTFCADSIIFVADSPASQRQAIIPKEL